MKTKIDIKNRFSDEIFFSFVCEENSIKKTVKEAIRLMVNLSRANLSGADLSGACLLGAKLSWANLSGACLSGADLTGAKLSRANLSKANLSGADLTLANLSRANLSGADLTLVKFDEDTSMFMPQCPDGSFIGWKKARKKIIKIEIAKMQSVQVQHL